MAKEYGVSFWSDENVLKLTVLMVTYVFEYIRNQHIVHFRWIVCYMNYISIKVLKIMGKHIFITLKKKKERSMWEPFVLLRTLYPCLALVVLSKKSSLIPYVWGMWGYSVLTTIIAPSIRIGFNLLHGCLHIRLLSLWDVTYTILIIISLGPNTESET